VGAEIDLKFLFYYGPDFIYIAEEVNEDVSSLSVLLIHNVVISNLPVIEVLLLKKEV